MLTEHNIQGPGLGAEIEGRLEGEFEEERFWKDVDSADLVKGREETIPPEERKLQEEKLARPMRVHQMRTQEQFGPMGIY